MISNRKGDSGWDTTNSRVAVVGNIAKSGWAMRTDRPSVIRKMTGNRADDSTNCRIASFVMDQNVLRYCKFVNLGSLPTVMPETCPSFLEYVNRQIQ